MMIYKLNDYIEKFPNNTFYNNAIIDSEIPSFIIENDFQKRLTETMKILYGNYRVNTVVENDIMINDNTATSTICTYLYIVNSYKYKKLYELMKKEYNPIQNYNMTESGTDTHVADENRNNTLNKGAINSNSVTGSQNSNNEHLVSPYEKTDYIGESKDTSSSSARTDTYREEARTDTNNEKYTTNNTDTHSLTREGNIGVTTTQQMIEAERKISDFSIYKVIAIDLMKEICYGVRGIL